MYNKSVQIVIKCGEGYGTRTWERELGRDKVALDKTVPPPPGMSFAVGETQGECVDKSMVSQGVLSIMRSYEAGEWEERVLQGSTQGDRGDVVQEVPSAWGSEAECREGLGERGPGRGDSERPDLARGRPLLAWGCGTAWRPAWGAAENKRDMIRVFKSIAWQFCRETDEVAGVAPKAAGDQCSDGRSSGLQEEEDFILFTCGTPPPPPPVPTKGCSMLNEQMNGWTKQYIRFYYYELPSIDIHRMDAGFALCRLS